MIDPNTNLSTADLKREVSEVQTPILMEFSAQWSGPSHILEPIIKDLASDFEEKIKVLRTDVDKNFELKEEFGIRNVPTILFFKKGQVVDYFVGIVPKREIEEKLIKILK